MGRSLKKGPFVTPKLFHKVEKQNDVGNEGADQDLGPGVHRSCRSLSGTRSWSTTAKST